MEKRPRMLTLKEVAEFLCLSEKTLYRLVKGGTIPALKIGGQWRFEQTILEVWVKSGVNQTITKSQSSSRTQLEEKESYPRDKDHE